MSTLAQLQIDLQKKNKRIGDLIASAGNMPMAELFNTACEAHMITSQLCIEINRLIAPSFLALPVTGEHTQGMTDLTDRRWEANCDL